MPSSIPMPGLSGLVGGALGVVLGLVWLLGAVIAALAPSDRSGMGRRLRKYAIPPLFCIGAGILVALSGVDNDVVAIGLPLFAGIAGVVIVKEQQRPRSR
jgi:hypothetical protein